MEIIKKFEPLFGEWYAESFIGAGSFGRVYKIYREELGNRFYSALKYISIPSDTSEIKQLRADGMDDASISSYYGTLARDISSETTLMNQLRGNTNIVSFEDSRIVPKPNGIGYDIFIRMELLDSLTNWMVENPLSPNEVVKLGSDICNALILCAKTGVIHRDIKPDNIFVSPNRDYKLGDFGIARQLEKTATFMSKKGTYNYMAPEVYKGEKYGATCDLYSLGLVMYRLLNKGRLPFLPAAPKPITSNDREQSLQQRFQGKPIPAPCDADEELSNIILKACAFNVKDRFATAEEMKDALTRYSNGEHGIVPVVPIADFDRTHDDADETRGVFGKSNGSKADDGINPNATSGVFSNPINSKGKTEAEDTSDKTHGVFAAAIPIVAETGIKTSAAKAPKNAAQQPKNRKNEKPTKKRPWWIVGVAAALALAFGLMAVLGVFGKNQPEPAIDANTATPVPTNTVVPTVIATQNTVTDEPAIVAPTVEITDEPQTDEPTGTPVSATPTPTPTPKPTKTPKPMATPKPTATPTPRITPTPTPKPDPVVTFSDETFEKAFRNNYGFVGKPIYMSDILAITTLRLPHKGISNISDVAKFTNLISLDLSYNRIIDISAVRNLTKLTSLNFFNNKIVDISSVRNLTNLTTLNISNTPYSSGNTISDISALGNLSKLTNLDLSSTSVADIRALMNLNKLEKLGLSHNSINDISALSNLTNLTFLNLSNNSIEDISSLNNMKKLKTLILGVNRINDISIIRNLAKLDYLDLCQNQISDISAVMNLTNLTELKLYYNRINDISALKALTRLTHLYIYNNYISNINSLQALTNLEYLDLNNNNISDVTVLYGLVNANKIWLTGNPLTQLQIDELRRRLPNCNVEF